MRGEIKFTDYLDKIRGLVTFQFENSPVFDKYLQLMSLELEDVQKVFKDLLELRSIDTAEGVQLDIIGKIVGQDRVLIDVNLLEFFGFQGRPPIVVPQKPDGFSVFGFLGHKYSGRFGTLFDPTVGSRFRNPYETDEYLDESYGENVITTPEFTEEEYKKANIKAGSFGTELDPSVGAVFKSLGDKDYGNIVLSDELYRVFIKAKIAKNVTRATPEDVMHFANFIFNTQGSSVEDEGGGSFRISIGRPLSNDEVSLLRYVNKSANYESSLFPKPIGVRMWFSSFDYDNFFAFAGVPNAKGFGEFTSKTFNGELSYDGEFTHSFESTGVGGKLASLHGEI